ncbi:serine/threonine-protein kinase [Actinopolyspora mortivallis]|uniref:serine/threonine-protein kinase n=1 Tax=Actinopolyspora mortivallis TaxID=33906 RepID=UPI0003A05A59|nr:serine/threonine-protein kinase [Actinopolyspora mortivallis]
MPDVEPEPDEPVAGRLIGGRYRLHTRIGGGAMGSVWSGTDELLRRPVAVKAVRLPKGIPDEEADEIRERTLREARAIAVVTHPNVVTLYDVAREGEEPFVVMELVPSRSLADIVREEGPLDDRQLAVVADAVAAALDTAHRSGVVHRDVKPGNVLLSSHGLVKLSDFGISRNIAEPTLTRTGIMLGTPAFIAPEVAAGEQVTSAADLWGLGATLFAAAEGRPPYDSDDNPVETITAVVHGPVPAPTRGGPVAEVVSGLMVKDPQRRMSLREVRRHVQPLLPEPGAEPFAHLLPDEPATERTPVVELSEPGAPTADESSADSGSTEAEPAGSRDSAAEHASGGAEGSGASEGEQEPAPLAADPGPLPFTPSPAPRRRRSRLGIALLAVGALVVFLGSAGGAFLTTRILTDRPPLPENTPERNSTSPESVSLRLLKGRLTHRGDGGGGSYRVPVPVEWPSFRDYSQGPPTRSMTERHVSPDGRQEVAVQRFGDYYPRGYTQKEYLDALRKKYDTPYGELRVLSHESNHSPQRGLRWRLVYRTTSYGVRDPESDPLRRFTVANLIIHEGDLWIVRVTAPRRDQARTLQERIVSGFRAL